MSWLYQPLLPSAAQLLAAVAPTITTADLGTLTVGTAVSLQLTATGDEPITWSATGLPDGLSLSSTGLLTGTPTTAGAYSATITATNAGGSDADVFAGTVVAVSTGAGRAKRRSRKYVVEIDGQEFVTESLDEARALLAKAKALATRHAEQVAAEVVEKAIAKARKVGTVDARVQQPVIIAPIELQAEAEVIRGIYRDAAINAELQAMMAIQAERDDEEVLLLSL